MQKPIRSKETSPRGKHPKHLCWILPYAPCKTFWGFVVEQKKQKETKTKQRGNAFPSSCRHTSLLVSSAVYMALLTILSFSPSSCLHLSVLASLWRCSLNFSHSQGVQQWWRTPSTLLHPLSTTTTFQAAQLSPTKKWLHWKLVWALPCPRHDTLTRCLFANYYECQPAGHI